MPQTIELSSQIRVSTALGRRHRRYPRHCRDYAVVVERLKAELAARHFNLLEKLAEYVATLLLETLPPSGCGFPSPSWE